MSKKGNACKLCANINNVAQQKVSQRARLADKHECQCPCAKREPTQHKTLRQHSSGACTCEGNFNVHVLNVWILLTPFLSLQRSKFNPRNHHRLGLLSQGQVFVRWCSEKLAADLASCPKGKILLGGVQRNSPQCFVFATGRVFQVVCEGKQWALLRFKNSPMSCRVQGLILMSHKWPVHTEPVQ